MHMRLNRCMSVRLRTCERMRMCICVWHTRVGVDLFMQAFPPSQAIERWLVSAYACAYACLHEGCMRVCAYARVFVHVYAYA